jgi:hypothetical protein
MAGKREIDEILDAAFEGREIRGEAKTAQSRSQGRSRGKHGRFEEERVGPIADLGNLLGFMNEEERKRDVEDTRTQARHDARHSSLQPAILVPMSRRVGVSLTLTIASVEALDRLSITRGVKRGQFLDMLLAAAVKAEFGGKEKPKS